MFGNQLGGCCADVSDVFRMGADRIVRHELINVW
jgi:hypothetical protein